MADEHLHAAGDRELEAVCDQDLELAGGQSLEAAGDVELDRDLEAARLAPGWVPLMGSSLLELPQYADDAPPSLERSTSAPPGVSPGPAAANVQPVALGRVTSAPVRVVSSSKVYPEDVLERDECPEQRSRSQPSLTRVISSASRLSPVVPTARCTICLEHFPQADLSRLASCYHIEHGACGACLGMYLKLRIDDGRVCDLKCPCIGDEGCDASASEPDLEKLCDAPTVEKYRRFLKLRTDEKARQCPNCEAFCRAELRTPGNENGGVVAEMHCQTCGQDFCYYHSNAHAVGREACAAYERDTLKRERAALAAFGSKKCPGCGIITDKTSGCNHMTCSKCSVEWCGLCGETIQDVGWHYNPLRLGTCRQFVERTSRRQHCGLRVIGCVNRVLICIVILVVLLFFALWFLLLLAAVVVCGCPAGGCMLCKKIAEGSRCEDFIEACSILAFMFMLLAGAILPFGLFWLSWAILMAVLWAFLLLPFGADVQQLQLMVLMPLEVLAAVPEYIQERMR